MTATDTTSSVGEERREAPGAADPVAAREAMVARLETAGQLRPGTVREALLAIRREVLIPQAYVRRSAPGEDPPRWDLLDWAPCPTEWSSSACCTGVAVCSCSTTGSRCSDGRAGRGRAG